MMSRPETKMPATSERARPVSQHLPATLLALLCGLVFYEAGTTLAQQGYASGTPISNAALYPRLLAGLLLILLGLQVVSDLRAVGSTASAEEPSAPGQGPPTVCVALGITAYIALLPVLGFLLATPILVFGMLLVLGDRNRATLIGVPPVMTAGCIGVFQGLFNVNLPRGIFGIALNL